MAWAQALEKLQSKKQRHCLVTLIGVEGSAPRDSGTKMVVDADTIYGTIGGGNLEFTCAQKARELLVLNQDSQQVEYFPLSAKFNQCCSGAVSVLFESFVSFKSQVVIFGAGHVAKELSIVLPRLGYGLTIIDQRPSQFDQFDCEQVDCVLSDDPLEALQEYDEQHIVLIMTHDHKLDFKLCSLALKDKNFRFLGLIGSKAKAKKFRTRLEASGIENDKVASLVSPIGLESIPGKQPMEVAVSVCGQLIAFDEVNKASQGSLSSHQGLQLKEVLQLKTESE